MISLTCCRPPVRVYRIWGLSPSAPQCESVQSDSMAVACAWAARLAPIARGWRPASMRARLMSRRTCSRYPSTIAAGTEALVRPRGRAVGSGVGVGVTVGVTAGSGVGVAVGVVVRVGVGVRVAVGVPWPGTGDGRNHETPSGMPVLEGGSVPQHRTAPSRSTPQEWRAPAPTEANSPSGGLGLPVGIEAPALDLSINPHAAGVLPAGAHRQ